MASIPGFDPNEVQNPESFKALTGDESAPLLNRPTQSTYPPGSTMKVVTAAAALDSGEFEPSTVLNADSPKRDQRRAAAELRRRRASATST